MQDLYQAVTVLHRSREDVRRNGWMCGTIGSKYGPKCINGVVSMAASPGQDDPDYITDLSDGQPELTLTLKLVSRALLLTVPDDVRRAVLADSAPNGAASYAFANPMTASLDMVTDALVLINDQSVSLCDDDGEFVGFDEGVVVRMMTKDRVLDWLEAAQDLLAQELPEPIPAVRRLVF